MNTTGLKELLCKCKARLADIERQLNSPFYQWVKTTCGAGWQIDVIPYATDHLERMAKEWRAFIARLEATVLCRTDTHRLAESLKDARAWDHLLPLFDTQRSFVSLGRTGDCQC